jgi:ATP-dependent exoDNAse (exonuclease V) alpha subunit
MSKHTVRSGDVAGLRTRFSQLKDKVQIRMGQVVAIIVNKVERFGWTFGPGDKVMQTENDYDKEVYDGNIGYIVGINSDDSELTLRFDYRPVTYGFGELDALLPAYAATVHKSQGSEYPAVVIPVLTQALPDAATKPALYGRDARQEAGRACRSKKGPCHRRPK